MNAYLSRGNTEVSVTSPCMRQLSIKPCRVIFPGLGELGVDDDLAIALFGVLGVVILVDFFGFIKVAQAADFGHDRMVPEFLVPVDRVLEEDLFLRGR